MISSGYCVRPFFLDYSANRLIRKVYRLGGLHRRGPSAIFILSNDRRLLSAVNSVEALVESRKDFELAGTDGYFESIHRIQRTKIMPKQHRPVFLCRERDVCNSFVFAGSSSKTKPANYFPSGSQAAAPLKIFFKVYFLASFFES